MNSSDMSPSLHKNMKSLICTLPLAIRHCQQAGCYQAKPFMSEITAVQRVEWWMFLCTQIMFLVAWYIGLFEIFYVTIYEVNLYLQNNIYLSRLPDRGDNCARNILPRIWFNFFSQIHKILWVINGSKQHFVFLTPCLGLSKYYFLSKIILSKFMADNVYT